MSDESQSPPQPSRESGRVAPMTRILVVVLKYGVGLGLLAWLIAAHWHMTSPNGEELGLAILLQRPLNPGRLALAIVCLVTAISSTFLRWYLLVRVQGLPFTFPSAVRLGLIGYFLNTFLPGTVGGDLLKATLLARSQERRTVAVATVFFDRLVGMTGLYFLAVVAGFLLWLTGRLDDVLTAEGPRLFFEGALAVALLLLVTILTCWLILQILPPARYERILLWLLSVPKVGQVLAEAWRAAGMYRARGRTVGLAFLLGIANHVLNVPAFYFAATTILPPADVPSVALHFLLVPIGTTIQASFPSPGGVGGGEFAFGTLFALLGHPFAYGVLAALLVRALSWTIGFVGYVVYLRSGEPGVADAASVG